MDGGGGGGGGDMHRRLEAVHGKILVELLRP